MTRRGCNSLLNCSRRNSSSLKSSAIVNSTTLSWERKMANKTLLGSIVALLVVIAGYLSYLAWDRHQHNLQEAQQHRKEADFNRYLFGASSSDAEEQRREQADAAAESSAASAAGLK